MRTRKLLLGVLLIGGLCLVGCQSTQNTEICDVCHKDNIDSGVNKYGSICGICEGFDVTEKEFMEKLNNDNTYREAIKLFSLNNNSLLNFTIAYTTRNNDEIYSKLMDDYNIPTIDSVEKYAKCANKISNYQQFKTVTTDKDYKIDLTKYVSEIKNGVGETDGKISCPECGSPRNGVCDNPNCSSNSGLDICVDCGSNYKIESLEYDSTGNAHCGCVGESKNIHDVCPVCGNDNSIDACDCLVGE